MGGLFFQNQKDKLKDKSKRQILKYNPKYNPKYKSKRQIQIQNTKDKRQKTKDNTLH